jgi:endonuclease YncB( thermonuclease family)
MSTDPHLLAAAVHTRSKASIGTAAALGFALAAGVAAAAEGVWTPTVKRVDPGAEQRERIAVPNPPEDDRIFIEGGVRLLGGPVFSAAGTTYRIAGIDLVERNRLCVTAAGVRWACGLRAYTTLAALLQSRLLVCRPAAAASAPDTPDARPVDCEAGGRSIARGLVEDGWALPTAGDDRLAAAAATARAKGRGMFATSPPE